ncbi:MAG: NAD(P)-dependent glycerol-3-phosphate dehydrogenase [Planctomycetota bacterium]|nr:NAD(P)-dependent glycerol-3-phosphate dehydrogenase [Planctomycetota bacterium]
MKTKITILGGGAMATACSIILAEQVETDVTLWVRNAEYALAMTNSRENKRLLPGIMIPEKVNITADVEAALAGTQGVVLSIPTKYLRDALSDLAAWLPVDCPIISVIKGIENETFMVPCQIIEDELGSRDIVALSGPSHAEEFARRLPASVVAASPDNELARWVQSLFTTDRFRVYTNPDLIGVELAGALKNVLAIAAGICDGQGFGDNAKAALITRGIAEISRYAALHGANPQTFSGLAGIGDLIATCTSRHSRNRLVGERLGKGETKEEIAATMVSVAEGVNTTRSVYADAKKRGLDLPVTTEVYRVIFERKSPVDASETLMMRPVKDE